MLSIREQAQFQYWRFELPKTSPTFFILLIGKSGSTVKKEAEFAKSDYTTDELREAKMKPELD